jgi:hypothetical protein
MLGGQANAENETGAAPTVVSGETHRLRRGRGEDKKTWICIPGFNRNT